MKSISIVRLAIQWPEQHQAHTELKPHARDMLAWWRSSANCTSSGGPPRNSSVGCWPNTCTPAAVVHSSTQQRRSTCNALCKEQQPAHDSVRASCGAKAVPSHYHRTHFRKFLGVQVVEAAPALWGARVVREHPQVHPLPRQPAATEHTWRASLPFCAPISAYPSRSWLLPHFRRSCTGKRARAMLCSRRRGTPTNVGT